MFSRLYSSCTFYFRYHWLKIIILFFHFSRLTPNFLWLHLIKCIHWLYKKRYKQNNDVLLAYWMTLVSFSWHKVSLRSSCLKMSMYSRMLGNVIFENRLVFSKFFALAKNNFASVRIRFCLIRDFALLEEQICAKTFGSRFAFSI